MALANQRSVTPRPATAITSAHAPLRAWLSRRTGSASSPWVSSVDRGSFEDVNLDGRSFVVIGHTPGNMGEGNWKVGLLRR